MMQEQQDGFARSVRIEKARDGVVKALKYYGREANYDGCYMICKTPITTERGNRARNALKKLEEAQH